MATDTTRESLIRTIYRMGRVAGPDDQSTDEWAVREFAQPLQDMDRRELRRAWAEMRLLGGEDRGDNPSGREQPTPFDVDDYFEEAAKVATHDGMREAVASTERLHPSLWATIMRDFGDLSVERRLQIAALVTGVCGACRDAVWRCYCWNDE